MVPNQGFNLIGLFMTLIPIIVICGFIFVIGSAIVRTARNVSSPVIKVNATVIGKRTEVTHHHSGDNMSHHSSTHYYLSFETEHRERIELGVSGREYGLLIEGDHGILIYQGTWFKDFQRGQSL